MGKGVKEIENGRRMIRMEGFAECGTALIQYKRLTIK